MSRGSTPQDPTPASSKSRADLLRGARARRKRARASRTLTPGERRRAASLLLLARAEFGRLPEPNRWLIRCAALGKQADFSRDDAFKYVYELSKRRLSRALGDVYDDDVRTGKVPGGERRKIVPWPTPPVEVDPRVVRWLLTNREALECVHAHGIEMSCVEVVGLLDLRNASLRRDLGVFVIVLRAGVDLWGSEGRTLNLGGSRLVGGPLDGGEGCALRVDGATFSGGVFLRDGFRAEGEVRLLGASVGGNLACSDGSFVNPGGRAVSADRAQIVGGVFMKEGFRAEGEVRLLGASVGGNFDCSGGSFMSPGGNAISADGAQIAGGVFMNNCFRAEGEVRLRGASVGGPFSCSDGSFRNPDGQAISADGAQIVGSVFMNDGFRAEGEVCFAAGSIEGNFTCTGGYFRNPDKHALMLDGIAVTGTLFLRGMSGCDGILDLTRSRIGYLNDDPGMERAAWPKEIILTDCRYEAIHADSPLDARSRLAWLHNHDKTFRGHIPDPQPYRWLADVLRRQGHDEDARIVLRVCAKHRVLPLTKRAFREGSVWPIAYISGIGVAAFMAWCMLNLTERRHIAETLVYWSIGEAIVLGVLWRLPDGLKGLTGILEGIRVLATQGIYFLLVGHGYARWRALAWGAGFW